MEKEAFVYGGLSRDIDGNDVLVLLPKVSDLWESFCIGEIALTLGVGDLRGTYAKYLRQLKIRTPEAHF